MFYTDIDWNYELDASELTRGYTTEVRDSSSQNLSVATHLAERNRAPRVSFAPRPDQRCCCEVLIGMIVSYPECGLLFIFQLSYSFHTLSSDVSGWYNCLVLGGRAFKHHLVSLNPVAYKERLLQLRLKGAFGLGINVNISKTVLPCLGI